MIIFIIKRHLSIFEVNLNFILKNDFVIINVIQTSAASDGEKDKNPKYRTKIFAHFNVHYYQLFYC